MAEKPKDLFDYVFAHVIISLHFCHFVVSGYGHSPPTRYCSGLYFCFVSIASFVVFVTVENILSSE